MTNRHVSLTPGLRMSITQKLSVEDQQTKAFASYINYTLGYQEPLVNSLCPDLEDGTILMRFVEQITTNFYPKPHVVKTPFDKLQNLNCVFDYLKDEKLNLTSSAEDILNGNKKSTLALIFQLILRYRLFNIKFKMTDFSHWIYSLVKDEKECFDVKFCLSNPTNWKTLMNSIQADTITDEDLHVSEDPIEQMAQCFKKAKDVLGFPNLLDPKETANGSVDDFCLYLYLTYFVINGNNQENDEQLESLRNNIALSNKTKRDEKIEKMKKDILVLEDEEKEIATTIEQQNSDIDISIFSEQIQTLGTAILNESGDDRVTQHQHDKMMNVIKSNEVRISDLKRKLDQIRFDLAKQSKEENVVLFQKSSKDLKEQPTTPKDKEKYSLKGMVSGFKDVFKKEKKEMNDENGSAECVECQRLKKEVTKLKEEIVKTRAESKKMVQQTTQQLNECRTATFELNEVKNVNEKQKEELEKMRKEKETTSNQHEFVLKRKSDEIEDLKRANEEIKKAKESLTYQMATQFDAMEKEKEEMQNALNTTKSTEEEMKSKYEGTVNELNAKIEEMTSQVEKSQNQCKELSQQLEEKMKNFQNEQNEKLQSDEVYKKEVQNLQNQISVLNKTIEGLQEENIQMNAREMEITDLKSKRMEDEKMLKEKDVETQQLYTQLLSVQNELEEVKKSRVQTTENATQQLEELQRENLELKMSEEQLKESLESLQTQLNKSRNEEEETKEHMTQIDKEKMELNALREKQEVDINSKQTQIDILKEQHDKMCEERDDLKRANEQLQSDKTDLKNKYEEVLKQNESKHLNECATLKGTIETLGNDVKERQTQVEVLLKDNTNLKGEVEELKCETNDVMKEREREMEEKKTQLEHIKTANEVLHTQIKEEQDNNKKLTSLIQEKENENKKLSDDLVKQQVKTEEFYQSREDELKKMKVKIDQLTTNNTQLCVTIESQKNENAQLKESVEKNKKVFEKLEEENKNLRDEVESATTQTVESIKKSMEEKEQLISQIEETKTENERLKKEVQEHVDTSEELRKELISNTNLLKEMKQNVSQLEREKSTYEGIRAERDDALRTNCQIQSDFEEERKRLSLQLEDKESANLEMRKANESYKQQIDVMSVDLENKNTAITQLQNTNEELLQLQHRHEESIQTLSDDNEAIRTELNELRVTQKEIEEAKTTQDAMKSECELLKMKVTELTKLNGDLTTLVEQVNEKNTTTLKEKEKMADEIVTFKQINDEKEDKLKEAYKRISSAEKEKMEAKIRIEEQEKLNAMKDGNIQNLKGSVATLTDKVLQKDEEMKVMKGENVQLRTEKEEVIDKFTQREFDLKEHIERKNNDFNTLQKTFEIHQNECAKEKEHLQEEVDEGIRRLEESQRRESELKASVLKCREDSIQQRESVNTLLHKVESFEHEKHALEEKTLELQKHIEALLKEKEENDPVQGEPQNEDHTHEKTKNVRNECMKAFIVDDVTERKTLFNCLALSITVLAKKKLTTGTIERLFRDAEKYEIPVGKYVSYITSNLVK
ncbi:myosin-2 heavy chain, non muscle, putative [Entamoeba invadens IP1]|uniref:Myosin-2 heavy chain, non muscle, putative n=1 Tax=Entamoeba invadens IP1 TaxID=370355 RepID=L7FMH7_ENTIV|nr:myosin-2 heavy chain, non muscle, putative [Entamoeba invadens IP1]ELP91562.1 myosin-2 heavy chain, non muscle, putative [Entamoeba invadens IP1]|eukprot:XP_004258333.1 myosin-2 heavy chain, non muscle, putative [Entamoeba invadens IP1]